MSQSLFEWGDMKSGNAPVLLHHLWGALDAGEAGQLAVAQILSSLTARRVATFNADLLIDYRSRRPIATMDNWCLTDMDGPILAIDCLTDYSGRDFLLLHGPEPDYQWEAFTDAVMSIASAFGVETSISLMGMPAGVPHTRSTFVHHTATNPSDVPTQPSQPVQVRMTTSCSVYLQYFLGQMGAHSFGLVAGVPYYLTETEFPQASAALLDKVTAVTDLKLPIGDLEAAASHMRIQLDKHIEQSEEMAHMVHVMEERYDKTLEEAPPASGFLSEPTLGDPVGSGDVLAAQIEDFLRGRTSTIFPEVQPHAAAPHVPPELFGLEGEDQEASALTHPVFKPKAPPSRKSMRQQAGAHRHVDETRDVDSPRAISDRPGRRAHRAAVEDKAEGGPAMGAPTMGGPDMGAAPKRSRRRDERARNQDAHSQASRNAHSGEPVDFSPEASHASAAGVKSAETQRFAPRRTRRREEGSAQRYERRRNSR